MPVGIPPMHIYENDPIQLYRHAAPLGVIRYQFLINAVHMFYYPGTHVWLN